jgi:hypothetical protein
VIVVAALGAVQDRNHVDFFPAIIDSVNDEVRILDQFTRAGHEPWSPHLRERVYLQERDSIAYPRDHLGGSRWIVLADPGMEKVEVFQRRTAEDDPHTP